jgi:hypothetical protein
LLNGPAITYPVRLEWTVSGSSTNPEDHDAQGGLLLISAGTAGRIDIRLVDDGVNEEDETLTLNLAVVENAVPGVQRSHTVTITERNVTPVARILVRQGGRLRTTVARDGGPITVSAEVVDPNPEDGHTLDWMTSDGGVWDPANPPGDSYLIDPSTLGAGFYELAVLVTDDGVPAASNRSRTLIRVVDADPALAATADSDGDGIDDATEGASDADGDRLPDYLDPLMTAERLPMNGNGFLLETQPGLTLRLGETAFRASGGVMLAEGQVL